MRPFGVLFLAALCACGAAQSPAPPIVVDAPPKPAPSATADAAPKAPPAARRTTPAFDALVRVLAFAEGWDPRRVSLDSYREEGGEIRVEAHARSSTDAIELVKRLQAEHAVDRITVLAADASSVRFSALAREQTHDLVLTDGFTAEHMLDPDVRNPFEPLDATPDPPKTLDVDADRVRLLGTLSGAAPRALFTGPTDAGWIGKVGDQVGTRRCRYRIRSIARLEVTLAQVDPSACSEQPVVRKLTSYRVK
ncbi:MAG TPA: hypothetical protein VIF62_34810 [Labilithrix sp.]